MAEDQVETEIEGTYIDLGQAAIFCPIENCGALNSTIMVALSTHDDTDDDSDTLELTTMGITILPDCGHALFSPCSVTTIGILMNYHDQLGVVPIDVVANLFFCDEHEQDLEGDLEEGYDPA